MSDIVGCKYCGEHVWNTDHGNRVCGKCIVRWHHSWERHLHDHLFENKLTRPFQETIDARAKRDPEFRAALKGEAVSEEKKANHQANLVRVTEILPHTNADTLDIIHVGDYQVVVKRGEFQVGDVGVYIQPDSIVPQTDPFKFIWETYVGIDGTVPEKRRRITVRKFRKEWSEGLLLNVRHFDALVDSTLTRHFVEHDWPVGTDVSDLLGITHYAPPEPGETQVQRKVQYHWPPKSFRGWVYYLLNLIGIDLNKGTGGLTVKGPKNPPPTYDVDSLRNYGGAFSFGEPVIATEKIHGSNARYTFDGKTFFVGSRTQWKSPKSVTIWHKVVAQEPWIETWCRNNPGDTLYGEVVPTQTEAFNYGYKDGRVGFFAFDILRSDGVTWSSPYREEGVLSIVPVLYEGPYDIDVLKKLAEGKSQVPGATGIREGIVIKPTVPRHVRGIGNLKLKLVSNSFLEKDNK